MANRLRAAEVNTLVTLQIKLRPSRGMKTTFSVLRDEFVDIYAAHFFDALPKLLQFALSEHEAAWQWKAFRDPESDGGDYVLARRGTARQGRGGDTMDVDSLRDELVGMFCEVPFASLSSADLT